MNIKKITVFVLMVMVLSANALSISNEKYQDKKKVTTAATFDGYDADDGYAFIIKEDETDEDSEETVYFAEASEEVLKAVNLKSQDIVGKRYNITYEITEYEEVDENGFTETFERFKIVGIKAL